jgi:DNA end-binding protein Ku
MLVDSLASEWRPEQYHDTYTEELRKRIKAKHAGKKIVDDDTSAPKAEVLDLMAALERSVESTRAKRKPAGKRAADKGAGSTRARKTRKSA